MRPESLIAGALFDFCVYLTASDKAITVSCKHDVVPLFDALKKWAKNRGLYLEDAEVKTWNQVVPNGGPARPETLDRANAGQDTDSAGAAD